MEKNLKKGDWVITCSDDPVVFGKYIEQNPADYSEPNLEWCKYNFFETIDGAQHSQNNCGCKPISHEEAVKFFNKKYANK